jgi:RimJ/RimL family protein N-acetyltransferase
VTGAWVDDDHVQLRTERLLLRRPLVADAADALTMLRDPEVVRWNSAPAVVDHASAVRWCTSGADWAEGSHATWHAVDAATGRLVANLSVFALDKEHATAKIGYRVAADWRGHGLGTEALTVVTSWAFTAMNLVRLQLEHAVTNPASCRVAEKSGYLLEGTLRSAYVDPKGVRHDEHVHGRLAGDPHPAVRYSNPRSDGD